MQHTTTQPKIAVISQTQQSVFKKSIFVIALASLGGITIFSGIVSLASAFLLFSNAALPKLAASILTDAILDITVGVLIAVSSRTFSKGKRLAIWLFGGSLLLDSAYSLIRGYELHYVILGLGLLMIWQILKFRQEWETS